MQPPLSNSDVATIIPHSKNRAKSVRVPNRISNKIKKIIESTDEFVNTSDNEEFPVSKPPNHTYFGVYVPGAIDNFWQCRYCSNLPIKHRTRHSVIFSTDKPDMKCNFAKIHIKLCRDRLVKQEYKIDSGSSMSAFKNVGEEETEREYKRVKMENNITTPFLDERQLREKMNASLLFSKDKESLLEYDLHVLRQLRVTYYNEIDSCKKGKKYHGVQLGFPGLECNHCEDKKFFFVKLGNLTNGYSRLVHHLLNCKQCPPDVVCKTKFLKDQLKLLPKILPKNMNNEVMSRNDLATSLHKRLLGLELINVRNVIMDGDNLLTTSILLVVFAQWSVTYVTDKENLVRASKFPIGHPGLQCIHCNGRKRNFVSSPKTLYHRLHEMQGHLMQCTECPDHIKDKIKLSVQNHYEEKKSLLKNSTTAMSRIQFIEEIWRRMFQHCTITAESNDTKLLGTSEATITASACIPENLPLNAKVNNIVDIVGESSEGIKYYRNSEDTTTPPLEVLSKVSPSTSK